MYGVRKCSSFILLQAVDQISQHRLLKRLSLIHCLDHAASECVEKHPDLAWTIREHRIKWAETRDGDRPHVIPFEALFDYIGVLEKAPGDVEMPPEVYSGLKLGENGKPVFSMDTRPVADDGASRGIDESAPKSKD